MNAKIPSAKLNKLAQKAKYSKIQKLAEKKGWMEEPEVLYYLGKAYANEKMNGVLLANVKQVEYKISCADKALKYLRKAYPFGGADTLFTIGTLYYWPLVQDFMTSDPLCKEVILELSGRLNELESVVNHYQYYNWEQAYCYNYAMELIIGRQIPRDVETAREILNRWERSSIQTSRYRYVIEKTFEAAQTLQYGKDGCPKDEQLAIRLYTVVADNTGGQDPKSFCALAECYRKGIIVERDTQKAYDLYSKSQNCAKRHLGLADIYLHEPGFGTPEDALCHVRPMFNVIGEDHSTKEELAQAAQYYGEALLIPFREKPDLKEYPEIKKWLLKGCSEHNPKAEEAKELLKEAQTVARNAAAELVAAFPKDRDMLDYEDLKVLLAEVDDLTLSAKLELRYAETVEGLLKEAMQPIRDENDRLRAMIAWGTLASHYHGHIRYAPYEGLEKTGMCALEYAKLDPRCAELTDVIEKGARGDARSLQRIKSQYDTAFYEANKAGWVPRYDGEYRHFLVLWITFNLWAIVAYEKKAKKGDVDAMLELSFLYENVGSLTVRKSRSTPGDKVGELDGNVKMRRFWLDAAIKLGSDEAMLYYYENRNSLGISESLATDYLKRAGAMGNSNANMILNTLKLQAEKDRQFQKEVRAYLQAQKEEIVREELEKYREKIEKTERNVNLFLTGNFSSEMEDWMTGKIGDQDHYDYDYMKTQLLKKKEQEIRDSL